MTKRYFVRIDLDNDAFANNPGLEVARILREISTRVEGYSFDRPRASFPVRDSSGNRCGTHGYTTVKS